jgi:hypothetical protein
MAWSHRMGEEWRNDNTGDSCPYLQKLGCRIFQRLAGAKVNDEVAAVLN